MSQGYGHQAYVGIGIQSAYDTAVAASVFAEIMSENMKGKRPKRPAGVLGSRSLKRLITGKAEVNGGFKFPLQWNGLEKILKHALGAVNTTGSNPYTHTYSLAAAPISTGLTVVVNRDAAAIGTGSMFRYVGCQVSKFTLGQKVDEPLTAEVELIGRDFGNVNIQAATFPTWDPIEYGQMTVANFDHAGTPTAMKIREWQMVIDPKIEPNHVLTDYRSIGALVQDQREVTFMFEIEFEDLTVWASFRDQTEQDYQFKWVSGTKSLQIDIPKAFITGDEPETGSPGPYFLKFTGRAEMNAADNDELALVLINSTAGPV